MGKLIVKCCAIEIDGFKVIGRCEMNIGDCLHIGSNSGGIDFGMYGVDNNHALIEFNTNNFCKVSPLNGNYIYTYSNEQQSCVEATLGQYYLIGLETYFVITNTVTNSNVGKRKLIIVENEKGDINSMHSLSDTTSLNVGKKDVNLVISKDPIIQGNHLKIDIIDGKPTIGRVAAIDNDNPSDAMYGIWTYAPSINIELENKRTMFRAARMIFVLDFIK